jgi:hypothetical protein
MPEIGGCAKGWVYDPVSKTCVRREDNPCKKGWVHDPTKKACVMASPEVFEKKKKIAQSCTEGWKFDPVSGTCVKEEDCKEGHVFNPTLNACVKKIPTCTDGWVFDSETGTCKKLPEVTGESCPIDSDFDSKTGVCMPRKDRKPISVIDEVPPPLYKSILWHYDPLDPILMNPNNEIAKGTVGDWHRTTFQKESDFLTKLDRPEPFEFIITDGIKNYYVESTRYKASALYQIAEEIYGKPILDPKTKRVLPEAIGREMMLVVSVVSDWHGVSPLVVYGRNRVLYVVSPKEPSAW